MNARKFLVLIGAALLALAIAMGIQMARQPQTDVAKPSQSLLPTLRGHVSDINSITLTGAEAKVILTLKRSGDGWTLAEKSGYPADPGKVRELLVNLEQSVLLEPKTAKPSRYADIGVDDVKDADADGVRVDLGGLPQPASVIVGLYNGANGEGTFVRRASEAQSWLASGNLTVAKNVAEWIRREIADIPSSRIKSVTLTGLDGKRVTFSREQADAEFRLADVPKGREPPTAYVLNGLASNLAGLKTTDVFPAKDTPPPERTLRADYVAFDGLVVTVIAWQVEGKNYAQLSAAFDPAGAAPADADKVKAEAEALNKGFAGWTFVLLPHRYGQIRKGMDDLLQPPAAKSGIAQ